MKFPYALWLWTLSLIGEHIKRHLGSASRAGGPSRRTRRKS